MREDPRPIDARPCEAPNPTEHKAERRASFVLLLPDRAYAVCGDCAQIWRRDDFLVRPMAAYVRSIQPNARAPF